MAAPLNLDRIQFFTNDGKPLALGTIDFYTPGTTSRKNTWTTADESSTSLNTNPITLDSAGSAVIYGQGYYEALIRDVNGNQIADCFGSAFTISSAIESFLLQTNAYDAINSIAQTGGNWKGQFNIDGSMNVSDTIGSGSYMTSYGFAINDGGQLLITNPTANETIATRTSFNVQGTTSYPDNREFLVSFGFTSDNGSDGQESGENTDKVTLYVGGVATKNSSNFWTLNTCLTMDDQCDAEIVQGYELDFNNNRNDRGISGVISDDLGGTTAAFGLSVTGASKFTSTSAIVTTGNTTNSDTTKAQWARSITNAGYRTVCSFHDLTYTVDGLLFDGIYTGAVINTTARHGNAGASAPTSSDPLAVLFMKRNHQIVWQNNAKSNLIYLGVSEADEFVVGGDSSGGSTTSSVLMGAKTLPLFDGIVLGNDDHPWGDFTGAGVYPSATDTFSVGKADAEYSDVYSQNAVTVSSDPSLKTNIHALPEVKDLIKNIDPIRFQWKRTDGGRAGKRVHWGFDAANVEDAFAKASLDFAGYVQKPQGDKALRPAQLLPVLWQALKEVYEANDALEVRITRLEYDH